MTAPAPTLQSVLTEALECAQAWRERAEAAEARENELRIEVVRFRKDVLNRLFGIIAPLVDDETWDEAHAKRIRRLTNRG